MLKTLFSRMTKLQLVNLALVVLLSIAAGVAKILQVPDEVAFFAQFGLGNKVLVAFGALQIIAGLLLMTGKLRKPAALLAAVLLATSAIMLLASGKLAFGLLSLVPVMMALAVFWRADSASNSS